MKGQNERKLIKNIDNIINKYLKIDDELLEAIAKEDDGAIKNKLAENSSDNFLKDIVEEYNIFTEELINTIKDRNQTKLQDFETKKTITRSKTTKQTKTKKLNLNPKKGRYQKWSKAEERRIITLKEAGKGIAEIKNTLNEQRIKNNMPARTYSSVRNKVRRVK